MIGDTASFVEKGKPLPGVAQVAIQQGRHAAKVITSRITAGSPPGPFSYFDKGNMAVVGKGFAVLESGKVQVSGVGASLAWAFVHLQFLATSSLRLSVFLQWVWTYVTGQRGSRLIVNHRGQPSVKAAETPPARQQQLHKTRNGEMTWQSRFEISQSWVRASLARVGRPCTSRVV